MAPRYVFLALILFSAQSFAKDIPDFPFLSVTGTAEIEVAPDMATISFSTIAVEPKAETAVATINQRAVDIVSMLAKQGVDKKDIESYQIDKQARYQRYGNDEPPGINGYQVTQRFTVELQSVTNYSDILGALMKLDNVENINTQFDIQDREQTEQALMTQAGQDARKKSETNG